REFLLAWRNADYFLWSTGRWRERERMGRQAADVAERLGEHELRLHALYDSVAETGWHRLASEEESTRLLDEARDLAGSVADAARHTAMVEYYRSRMLRIFKKPDEALLAGTRARELAVKAGEKYVVALC